MKLKIKGGRKILWIMIGAAAVVAVAGFSLWERRAKAEDYLTARVGRGNIRNSVSATGALQAVTTVQVGSQASGTIAALYADFNTTVKKGQVVAQLDPAIFEAQVASARANLEQARAGLADAQAKVIAADSAVENQRAGVSSASANLAALKAARDDAESLLKRQEELVESGIIPQRDYESSRASYVAAAARYNQAAAQVDQARVAERSAAGAGLAQSRAQVQQARAQVQQAQASLQLAEVNLSHTSIRSPIDGVVVSRDVDVGQTVAASLSAPTIFTIANDLTRMQVMANIDQADIGVINESNRINFTVDAFPGQNFKGTIRQIRLNPQNVQNVVTYNVVIDVENPDLKLKPGMTANLTFTIAEAGGALKIPNAALRFVPPGVTQDQIRELVRGGAQPPPAAETPQRERPDQPQAGPAAGGRRQGGAGGGGGPAAATAAVLKGQTRIVWVPGPENRPRPVKIKLGITDGVATEVAEGELKEGDAVIVGVNRANEPRSQGTQRPPGFGGPGGGGGRR